MVLIKVHYDGYNRQFKLVDQHLAHLLDDGETYMLIADVSLDDLKPASNTTATADSEMVIFAS
jgi:hypothetical protein